MAELASPNVDNYGVLKGILYWTGTSPSGAKRALGNCPQFSLELGVDKLDHFSSMAGTKSKDFSATIQKTGTVKMTLDEITLKNFQLALLGGSLGSDPITETTEGHGLQGFDIGSVSQFNGVLELIGTNDLGPKYRILLPSVNLTPDNAIDFINDGSGWTNIELSGDVLIVNGSFGRFDLLA